MVALAAVAAPVVLHGGQVEWFLPGTLRPSQVVRCSVAGRVVSARVPTIGSADWGWTGHVRMSMSRASNGGVEVACNTRLAQRRRPTMPYVIGQNGVALIRGASRLAQLKQRYGRPTSMHKSAATCTVAWGRTGLWAAFTSCSAQGTLVEATATSRRWSSLTGIYVGEPLPRMLFEAPYAKRLSANHWRLAFSHGHSLDAVLGAGGRVVRLVAALG